MPFKLINLWQSKEERRAKFHLARSLGANYSHARRMRDWRLSKIERRYGLSLSPEAQQEDTQLG